MSDPSGGERKMKKTVFAAILVFWGCFCGVLAFGEASARSEIGVEDRIVRVTVYSDRALVEREARVNLPAGGARLVFDNLPERTEPSSLQVRGQGGAILEDIVFQVKYFSDIPDEKIRSLTAARAEKERRIRKAEDLMGRAEAEREFLGKIVAKVTAVSEGTSTDPSPEKWIAMLKFYAERLAALDESILATETELQTLEAEAEALDRQLADLQAGRQKKKNQAVVIVNSEKPAEAAFVLTYLVYGPSWSAVYDLRVDSQKKTLELGYNASLTQNTGEAWTEAALVLSTARVEVGGRQPSLDPWRISLYNAADHAVSGRLSAAGPPPSPSPRAEQMMNVFDEEGLLAGTGAASRLLQPQAVAQAGASAVLFVVPGTNTIGSDNTSHRVSLMTRVFPAVFRYSAVPKLSPFAYLKAKVKNSSDFPLIPGNSKIFLDGNFVADAGLDFVAPSEEFWTFLGVDEALKVEYKLIKRLQSEEGLLAKFTRVAFQYETVLTNNRKSPAEIVVWDQLPIPSDARIQVKLLDPKLDAGTANPKKDDQERLEWLFNLAPGETKKVPFAFTVEYPAGTVVEGIGK